MSVDPIRLLSTGSIEQSSKSTSSATGSASATTGASSKDSIATSAFILDENLATFLSNGSRNLSGAGLATYNVRALASQNAEALVSSLAPADDASAAVIAAANTLSLHGTMLAAAANVGSSTGEAEAPVRTRLEDDASTKRDGNSDASDGASKTVLAAVLETSAALRATE